jgi:hypothetical protein
MSEPESEIDGDETDGPGSEDPWPPVGDAINEPVGVPWREGTLTRAKELDSLAIWLLRHSPDRNASNADKALYQSLKQHLTAAERAAVKWTLFRGGARHERAISNLDAAEADLLQIAPPDYVLGQFPGILNHVQRHLGETDRRRIAVEQIGRDIDDVSRIADASRRGDEADGEDSRRRVQAAREQIITENRQTIASVHRAASSAALREQTRIRSFRNVTLSAALSMTIVAVALVVVGVLKPTALPLCFAPEDGGTFIVVCPTQQSAPRSAGQDTQATAEDIDDLTERTVSSLDTFLVSLVGLTAAAVAAAAALRTIRGSSEPYGVPTALAVLKLPTGAVTAVLGLLLMRGEFIPGLSALDSSAQIIAWAAIFGYAQQLFTRLVDQQAQTVLGAVRSQSPTTRRTSE